MRYFIVIYIILGLLSLVKANSDLTNYVKSTDRSFNPLEGKVITIKINMSEKKYKKLIEIAQISSYDLFYKYNMDFNKLENFEEKVNMTTIIDGKEEVYEKANFKIGGRYARVQDRIGFNIKLKKNKLFYNRKDIRLRPDALDYTHIRSKISADLMNHPVNIKKCFNEKDEYLNYTQPLYDMIDRLMNVTTIEELSNVFDIENYTRMIIAEYLFSSFDNYLIMGHNFHLYQKPDGKWDIIDHDYDSNFGVNLKLVLGGYIPLNFTKIVEFEKYVKLDFDHWQALEVFQFLEEIETCIECSAKSNINISEVIYFAQKAILYPTAPIYDSQINALKPACVQALSRIFKLCDLEGDGILTDEEIMKFQKYCFSQPLSEEELFLVKEIIKENYPEGVNERGLTQSGFLFLHNLFICQGSVETTWEVLRKYGYDDNLSFREDFIHPKMEIPEECTIELKKEGYDFFKDLFNKYDKDNDGVLCPRELNELFSITPGNPWISMDTQQSVVTDKNGNITLQGFLSQWSLITWLDYKVTLEYLAYFGYGDNTTSVFEIIPLNKKHSKYNKKIKRKVYSCCVLGATGSGKIIFIYSY
ncbi:hypothetical protein PIROE2DRAFT_69566 [Piromyces sp. E2]|nr:hypothetical protein PIROE2DRAFT_69566 [Piromyces sp. E2]|eukprot:OUM61760.1 hypothetical protein PIROE2DRAFT_69566 [Piromyces sp. E2]